MIPVNKSYKTILFPLISGPPILKLNKLWDIILKSNLKTLWYNNWKNKTLVKKKL